MTSLNWVHAIAVSVQPREPPAERARKISAACSGEGDLAVLGATREELERVRWLTFLYTGSPLEDAARARNGAALEYMRRARVCVHGLPAKKIAESLRDDPAMITRLVKMGLLAA